MRPRRTPTPVRAARTAACTTAHVAAGLVTAVIAVAALGACSSTTGSGTPASESRPVSGFSAVELAGVGTVVVEPGTTESVTVEADDNILPMLSSDVAGDTLVLGTEPGSSISPRTPISYRVTVTDLSGLLVSGSGDITAGGAAGPALSVAISGSGTITTAGTTDRLSVDISGSGDFAGGSLTARDVDVTVSGSGSALVHASATLHASISGSGDVRYLGEPTVTKDVSGSGEVVKQ
ncbi:head GIN domain-containing protein [Intrasporangium sp. YIM S08009]|uniref:head GIN domain-containing protein n=1 Tax=Intrasporangium zincisolvens TaxID=3080018 RepID=UPI002B0582FC|nr:head GIN domain-containing protein [Intrasporangium sp. YIM S08009]